MAKGLIPVLFAVFLGGCLTTGQSTFCHTAKEQFFTRSEWSKMTPRAKRFFKAHNLKGKRLCGWRGRNR